MSLYYYVDDMPECDVSPLLLGASLIPRLDPRLFQNQFYPIHQQRNEFLMTYSGNDGDDTLNAGKATKLHQELDFAQSLKLFCAESQTILPRVSNYFAQSLKLLRILGESCDYREPMLSTLGGEIPHPC